MRTGSEQRRSRRVMIRIGEGPQREMANASGLTAATSENERSWRRRASERDTARRRSRGTRSAGEAQRRRHIHEPTLILKTSRMIIEPCPGRRNRKDVEGTRMSDMSRRRGIALYIRSGMLTRSWLISIWPDGRQFHQRGSSQTLFLLPFEEQKHVLRQRGNTMCNMYHLHIPPHNPKLTNSHI